MLAYVFFALSSVLRYIGNLLRRLRRGPDYVVFALEGAYPEIRPPPANFWQRRLSRPQPSLQDLAEQFRVVAGDPGVGGVVLILRPLAMPFAHLQTLRDLIGELRQARKRVVVWASSYDNARYYVACAADEVLIQPGGSIGPLGVRSRFLFLADALAYVGLRFEAVQISPYKSAADVFTHSKMSDEARQMFNWLLDSIYDQFLQAVGAGRRCDLKAAQVLVDSSPLTDLQALERGAVDDIVGEEVLPDHLGQGQRPATLVPWPRARQGLRRPQLRHPGRHIALVRIEGAIVDGRSQRPPIRPPLPIPLLLDERAGDISLVQAARQLAQDKRAAAVVVYVNSPGGSATASEAIAAALEKLAAKKPVVVAMGGMAASGGYYVATAGQWIVAQPGTLTGSIGVLFGKMADVGLFERLLFQQEVLHRGQNVRLYDPDVPFGDAEREIVWEQISRTYDVFLDRVATSRKMTREAVDAIGGGRVWTGSQALDNGLIDELGGFERALQKARELAGLPERVRVRSITVAKTPLAPVSDPAAFLVYLRQGWQTWRRAGCYYLSPLLGDDFD
jgi:protease IV